MSRIETKLWIMLGIALSTLGGPSPGHADCPADSTEEVHPIELTFDVAQQYGDGPENDPLLGQGIFAVDRTTTDDLSMSPERWNYLGVVPKPNVINFFWGAPVFDGQATNDWGRAIVTDPENEPLLGFCDPWSPLLGLHAANWLGRPAVGDPFGSPHLEQTGYFGPISTRELDGDPTGLSCDETTFEVRSPGDEPVVHYTMSTKGARVIKDGWDITWEWFPNAFYFLTCGATQFGYAHGTYKGKKVEVIGAFDRYYLAADSVFYLLDKRMLNVFAARGVDGKFEYGLVFVFKNAVWNGNSKFIAGGAYCREGEGCVATNELKLRNMTWKADPKFPHSIIPVEGTYIIGEKEVYMKAVDGFQLKQLTSDTNDLLSKAVDVATVPLQWADAMGNWRERNSPKQNLAFNGIETTEFNWQDIEEIEAAIGLPDVPGGGGIDTPGGTGGGGEPGDGGTGSMTAGDAGATNSPHVPSGSSGGTDSPDGGAGATGDQFGTPHRGGPGGCGGCAATPGAQFADSGLILVALASLLRRRR